MSQVKVYLSSYLVNVVSLGFEAYKIPTSHRVLLLHTSEASRRSLGLRLPRVIIIIMEVFNVSVIQIYKRTIVHWLITSDLPANISFLSLMVIK